MLKYSLNIFNDLSDAILVIDRNYQVVFANKAIQNYCKTKPEEIIGQKCHDFSHRCHMPCGKSLTDIVCPYEKVFENGESVSVVHDHQMPDGTERVIEVKASPIRDEKGDIVCMVEVLRDITDQKHADELIRESEEHLRTILDSIRVGIVIIDQQTHKIVDANLHALEMLRTEKEQALDKICHGYMCPAEVGKCPITDLKQTIDLSERELINTDGNRIPILKNVVSVKRKGQSYLVESFVDITDRKEAEKELIESETKLHSILEGIGDGVMVIDRDFRIISANRGYSEQIGISRKDITGKHCFEVSHHFSKPCYEMGEECSVKNAFETGISHRIIHTHFDKDGRRRYIETVSYPLKDISGNIVSAVEVLTDVTKKYLLEEDLKNKVKELEEFYAMAVGRELKMIELKNEIEKLKAELGKFKRA